ncbi:hypothetical protein [Nocardia farcinica]|uniref:Plasmid replication, integration and excision activator n=1 Tax=Nocardia farcinica (strain IFM 10152) TaxID=247156 RepID=Q5Z1Z4_NOCFA|nr:hypothetical protein [Nocardia farcinica]BAD55547.1 hypothetical protein NFA_7020 [Nocardia farcinica IFM 10152]
MALKGYRFPIAHAEAFPQGLVLVGQIEPLIKYNPDRNAVPEQQIDYNPKTGAGSRLPMWKATVTDPSETNAKRASFQLIFLSEVEPVPSTPEVLPGMRQIELEGLLAEPKVMGTGEFKYQGFVFYAGGIKGDNSGARGKSAAESRAA